MYLTREAPTSVDQLSAVFRSQWIAFCGVFFEVKQNVAMSNQPETTAVVDYELNEEIQLFREYLRIPSVHPNVDYGTNYYTDLLTVCVASTSLI